jgi:hypothetical protein
VMNLTTEELNMIRMSLFTEKIKCIQALMCNEISIRVREEHIDKIALIDDIFKKLSNNDI